MKIKLTVIARCFLYAFFAVVISTSCTSKKAGEIVMDKDGNYYELTHDDAFMGTEMYRLEQIDTTKYAVRGFNCNPN